MMKRDHYYFLHLLIQSLAATVFMFLLLFSLNRVLADEFIWAAGASTLASTVYIVFGTPHVSSAKPYRILMGYITAMCCGYLLQIAAVQLCDATNYCVHLQYHHHVFEIAAAIAVGLSFLVMFLLRFYHPPAAGLALVMVLDIHNIKAIVVICIAVLVLVLIRLLFAKQLRPLV